MTEYVGIADCHGIESFFPSDQLRKEDLMMMHIRCESNAQRHALVFRVTLKAEQERRIQSLLNSTNYILALKLIKELNSDGKIKNFEISRGKEHLFKRIPNPKLDPYHKGGR